MRYVLTLVLALGCTGSARAHFLFIRILPAAEAGRFAEVYFSDRPEAGDPRFLDKIAPTKLWLQSTPGQFTPLETHKTPDRLRAAVPTGGSIAVIGELTYGVIGSTKKMFLLRHYPKAVAGKPDDIRAFQAKPEIPLEIQLRPANGGLEFIAMANGKPIADARFSAVGLDLKEHKFGGSEKDGASWKPSAPGTYAVYTSRTLNEKGVHQGQKYDEIREFATIAFTWPLEAKGADPKAVAMFQEALATRASWRDFPGFSAEVQANADGRAWKGTATVSAKGDATLTMEDEVVAPWVKEQLESMAMHRIARSADKDPVLRFADRDADHVLGRLLVFEGGSFASSYRVKDRQITVVNRALGKVNMTITVLDNDLNIDKKFLPRSYTVQYWNAASGQLQRSETIQNRWTRVGSFDLPTQLTMLTASGAGLGVKSMSLSQHRLLK